MANILEGKNVLVCGGTGSIGSEIVRQALRRKPKHLRVLGRDETKLQDLLFSIDFPNNVRPLIGDIRDKERLRLAMEDVDIVFNAAALKHVTFCEYNPFEAVKTNVIGSQNIIDVALEKNVKRVITISTDKATQPNSTLGATKLLAERLTAAGNFYRGDKRIRLASVRFGNVLGSRNSILPRVKSQIQNDKPVTITDKNMTRFVMSIEEAVGLIFESLQIMQGGEVFILKMPSVRIENLIKVFVSEFCKKNKINKNIKYSYIGLQPGEKINESLLTNYEAISALENERMFILFSDINNFKSFKYPTFKKILKAKEFTSDSVDLLSDSEITKMISKIPQLL